MKIMFIGDICSKSGEDFFLKNLSYLKEKYQPNLLIVNGENIHENGRGMSHESYKTLMQNGVNMITMGNHTFARYEILDFIDNANIVRPANFHNVPGVGYKIVNFNDKKVLIINAMGRVFMNASLENPFLVIDEILSTNTFDYSFLDFHAEASAEKIAIGHYFDGKIDCIVGTHTHVQTADERKLPKGTLYITDVGMTGPLNGVIGVKKELIISRFIDGFSKHNVPESGLNQLNGILADLDKKTIERINLHEKD